MIDPFFDYSEHTEKLKRLNRELFDTLLKKEYTEAIKITEEIVVHARAVRAWCIEAKNKS